MASTQQNLEDRLSPAHLAPATDELAKEALEANAPPEDRPEAKKDPNDDPRAQITYDFVIDHTDARGNKWKGAFTNKVLNVRERKAVSLMQARMRLNQSVEAFSALAIELQIITSHLAVSLTKRPKWAENLEEMFDFAVLQLIYDEVYSHEEYFLGWKESASSSTEERGDGASESP